MQKRIIACVLLLCTLACTFASCDSDDSVHKVYNIKKDESYESEALGNVIELRDLSVSSALYEYVYLNYKEQELDYYESFDSYYGGVISNTVAIEDTEAFWTSEIPSDIRSYVAMSDDDVSFADALNTRVDSTFSYLLVFEELAAMYGFKLEDVEGYNDLVTENINEAIEASGIIEGEGDIADADGVLYDWVLDRWDTYLAGKGINASEWARVYCNYSVYTDNLEDFLAEKGVIEALDEDSARAELVEYLVNYKAERIKFRYVLYAHITEEEFDEVKASLEASDEESSEDVSDEEGSDDVSVDESAEDVSGEESSDDASSDESGDTDTDTDDEELDFYTKLVSECDTYEEVNARVDALCEEIYAGLLDGSKDFDEEYKNCPYYSLLEAYYPDGVIITKESFTEATGLNPDEMTVGEIQRYDSENEIQFIKLLELTDDDISTEPTDEEIQEWIESSVDQKFSELLTEIKETVVIDKDLLYNKPWKV